VSDAEDKKREQRETAGPAGGDSRQSSASLLPGSWLGAEARRGRVAVEMSSPTARRTHAEFQAR
jgi:hypothetical protein